MNDSDWLESLRPCEETKEEKPQSELYKPHNHRATICAAKKARNT